MSKKLKIFKKLENLKNFQTKKIFFSIIFLILIISVVHVGKVRPLSENKNPVFHVNTVNRGDSDFEDARVTIFMPDFGIFYRTNKYDLNSNNVKVKQIEFNLPEEASGWYPVRVTLSNDKYRKVKYSWIYIT